MADGTPRLVDFWGLDPIPRLYSTGLRGPEDVDNFAGKFNAMENDPLDNLPVENGDCP